MLGGVIFLLGCALQAGSASMQVFLVGRLITGTSIGLLSNVVPLYQAEMAPQNLRGTLTSMYNMMITSGIFVAALLDVFLVDIDGGWRTAIALQALPALIILSAMPFLPRSPRWLVQQGRNEEAERMLAHLRGDKLVVQKELQEILAEYQAEKELSGSWKEVFSGKLLRLVCLGSALQMLQQLVGMNAFMYFGPRIFADIGFNANLFQTVSNAVNMIFTLPALYFIECTGRRFLFMGGAVCMAVATLALGLLGSFGMEGGHGKSPAVNTAMAAMVLTFVAAFASTWGPVVWVYCAEMFPLRYRARCVGVTTMTNWIGNFLIAQFTPMLLAKIGFDTFFIFGFFCLLALLLGWWLPETAGVPLEQVGLLFDHHFQEEKPSEFCNSYGAIKTA
ncbi:unnamed protein product [Effrenium voratum]|nr:unnamed protein product [Effrenium voratum]